MGVDRTYFTLHSQGAQAPSGPNGFDIWSGTGNEFSFLFPFPLFTVLGDVNSGVELSCLIGAKANDRLRPVWRWTVLDVT